MDATGWRFTGAIALLVAGLQYLVLEAVAAASWTVRPYDYAANYISDLGVTEAQIYRGRAVGSPLAWLMNTAFVAQGVLFAAGAVLVSAVVAGASRRLFVTFAVLHGVGMVTVGLFDEATGIGKLHHAGAGIAVLCGNAALLVVAVGCARAGLPRWFASASLSLPVAGLLCEAVLFSNLSPARFDGLWERGGVYSIILWEVVLGMMVLALVRAADRSARPVSPPVPASSRGPGRPATRVRRRI